MIDPIQRRYLRVNHEGAHAAAAHVLGNHPIKEIRVDRPEDGTGDWVWFVPPTGDVSLRTWWTEFCVIMRVGALVTNTPWDHESCASDRRTVLKIHRNYLSDIPLAALETLVELDAKELTASPTFKVAYRALGRELLDHLHEVMPGGRAHQIMDDALRVVAST